MTRYSFSTFNVDDQNRQGHDMCLAVGLLAPLENRTLLLVGGSGCGKTHLLCAVVDRLREEAPRTALGYVTAKQFPAEVRALREDAAPVTRAKHAVLLVDQLDKFSEELLKRLAEVAPLFVGENRYLVFASRVKPEALELPEPLRALIDSAQVCVMREEPPQPSPEEELKAELARVEGENQILEDDLRAAHKEIMRLSEQLKDFEADYLKLEEANAVLAVREQEARSLQQALEETRRQRDALVLEKANLEVLQEQAKGDASRAGQLEQQLVELEGQLAEVRKEAEEAKAELNRLTLRAQSILQQVELNRIRFAENEEAQYQQVLTLQQRAQDLATLAAPPEGGNGEDTGKMRPWYVAPFMPPIKPPDNPQP